MPCSCLAAQFSSPLRWLHGPSAGSVPGSRALRAHFDHAPARGTALLRRELRGLRAFCSSACGECDGTALLPRGLRGARGDAGNAPEPFFCGRNFGDFPLLFDVVRNVARSPWIGDHQDRGDRVARPGLRHGQTNNEVHGPVLTIACVRPWCPGSAAVSIRAVSMTHRNA